MQQEWREEDPYRLFVRKPEGKRPIGKIETHVGG
jgi:hypothetical protein